MFKLYHLTAIKCIQTETKSKTIHIYKIMNTEKKVQQFIKQTFAYEMHLHLKNLKQLSVDLKSSKRVVIVFA